MNNLKASQKLLQKQSQTFAQKQIQTLNYLSFSQNDLKKELEKAAEENPAILIKNPSRLYSSKESNIVSSSASQKSDDNQKLLETQEDYRETLQNHLMEQLNSYDLSQTQQKLAEKLIYNLDEKGFFLLDPISLLDSKDKNQTPELLKKTIRLIQDFEPEGICCKNLQESLLIQTRYKENPPILAIYLLKEHFELLESYNGDNVKFSQQLRKLVKDESSMFASKIPTEYKNLTITEDSVEKAIRFIGRLDPVPARNFSTSPIHTVSADIKITKLEEKFTCDDFENMIIVSGDASYKIELENDSFPQIQIDDRQLELLKSNNLSSEEKENVRVRIQKAKDLQQILEYRTSTIRKASFYIFKKQIDYIQKGSGNLNPLTQTEVAEYLNVHKSTISRLVNEKYVYCSWGFKQLKEFFSKSVATPKPSAKNTNNMNNSQISKDKVIAEINKILQEHKYDSKKISDQKISDELASKGIHIARRTVAKYRTMENLHF